MKLTLLLATVAAFTASAALAQDVASDWPQQAITLVVPFPPGNNTDNVARIVANSMSERLGQPVVIDNRPGASGAVGMNVVATASPDGYTIGIGTASTQVISALLNPNLPYDAATAFAPIGEIGTVPYVLAVTPTLAAKDVPELIALAKKEPATLTYGSVGEASLANLSALLLSNSEGIQLTHVPYKSAGEAALDVIAGRIDMQFSTLGATLPFIQSGQLRALAVATAERVPELPDVPTIAESGVAGYESSLWFGLVAPTGLPEGIETRLNKELNAALGDPAVIKALAEQGVTPHSGSPEELAQLVDADLAKWKSVVDKAGIKAE